MNGQTAGAVIESPAAAEALKEKFAQKTATIGVVGLGYVGLPLAMEYALKGFRTVGFDLDTPRIDTLNAGRSCVQDVPDAHVEETVAAERFRATDDFRAAAECDALFICVPTPVTAHKDPDTTYIESATRSVAPALREGQLVVLKSTTYPNTTEGIVQPILEAVAEERGLVLGRDYFLAFSPERIDPGNKQFTTSNTPVVVGGVTAACTDVAARAMQQIVEHVHEVSSPKVGEMEKLLENIFRSVNIALVNELAQLCDRMGGVSIWEVVEAAATKPFGFMPFFPGPGLGGHCIPIDPYYLSWLARRYDFETNFITLAARVNEQMPYYVVEAVLRAIAEQPVRLSEAKVLVLGVAFKKNIDDVRHSPADRIVEVLKQKGVQELAYSDPYVPSYRVKTEAGVIELESVEVTPELVRAQDVVVLVTDHDDYDYAMIAREAASIVDTRNAFKGVEGDRSNIKLLGSVGF